MRPACLRIEQDRSGRRVRCLEQIRRGDGVLVIWGCPTSIPDGYSIQLTADLHLAPEGSPWGFVNHSCDPNLVVDFGRWRLVARRQIHSGEELTWNYLTTEWELQSPFDCNCGAPSCVRRVRGFRYLTSLERYEIAGLLSPFLRSRVNAECTPQDSRPSPSPDRHARRMTDESPFRT